MEHAHELPEFLHFLEEIDLLRGFVFGFNSHYYSRDRFLFRVEY